MSGQIKINTILTDSNKTVVVDDLQTASEVQTAIKTRSGDAGAFSFRNKIVDGSFDFWYEGTSQTTSGYGSATMWNFGHVGTTKTATRENLIAGVDLPAIEVPSAKYFLRHVVSSVVGSSNFCKIKQCIASVNTLAGKTITLSFYAKADTSGKRVAIEFYQSFGTSGSTGATVFTQVIPITTSWARYSVTATLPSISNKTIDPTNDCLVPVIWFDAGSATACAALGQQSGTFDIACVQLEEGTVATPFEELPIEISNLRLKRYYSTSYDSVIVGQPTNFNRYVFRTTVASTAHPVNINFGVKMRTESPVIKFYSTSNGAVGYVRVEDTTTNITATASSTGSSGIPHIVVGTAQSANTTISFHWSADARL